MYTEQFLKNIVEQYIPFHRLLNLQLLSVREGFAQISIPYAPELVGDPRVGRLHGGVISTAMDAAGGAAAITTLSHQEDQLSTIDMRVDYLYPGQSKDIVVSGEIVRDGKSVIFTRMWAQHPDEEQLIAEARAVYRVSRHKERK